MVQYGQEQYGTVQYGGGVQARATTTNTWTTTTTVTSRQAAASSILDWTDTVTVTSRNTTARNTLSWTDAAVGDVVGRQATASTTLSWTDTAVVTSASDTASTTNTWTDTAVVTFPLAPTGHYWYLNRTTKDEYIVFNGATSTYPEITIGEEITLDFYIKDEARFQDAETRYNRVKDLSQYAGYATTQQGFNEVYYREDSDYARMDYDTLLVRLEPGDDVDEARGVWGLVMGVDDSTEIFGAVARVSLSVLVLADADEYDNRSAVEADLKT